MTDEVWVRSPSLPFLSISSCGRFLIDSYEIVMPNGGRKVIATKPTKGVLQKSGKYIRYKFINKKNKVSASAHILIAEAFLEPKPFPKAVIIHRDEDATNNEISNLKWGSQKENLNGEKYIAYRKSCTGDNSSRRKGMMKKST